jgi:hypothetical protein
MNRAMANFADPRHFYVDPDPAFLFDAYLLVTVLGESYQVRHVGG